MANAEDVDAIVFANDVEPFLDSSFWYITAQKSGCFEDSYAIVRKDGSMDVLVNILEEETARTGQGNVRVYHDRDEFKRLMHEALDGCRKVGFNAHAATYGAVETVRKASEVPFEVVDASEAVAKTFAVKDADEIVAIRHACRISSQVACELPDYLTAGVTERQVAARMDARMRELGGTGNAFDTIAAFGANASQPHYAPGECRLREHDVALFDFGTKYSRYCSDLTRTIFFREPVQELRRAYAIVEQAQEAGFAEYHAGADAAAADLAARKVVDDSEFKGRFIHSFGHGIGMDVHQPIYVSPRSKQKLAAGNVVSAEPGIYLPGVGGIRIEDTVLITEDGAERLTSYPHELTVV